MYDALRGPAPGLQEGVCVPPPRLADLRTPERTWPQAPPDPGTRADPRPALSPEGPPSWLRLSVRPHLPRGRTGPQL